MDIHKINYVFDRLSNTLAVGALFGARTACDKKSVRLARCLNYQDKLLIIRIIAKLEP